MESFLKKILKKSLTKKEIQEKRESVLNPIKSDELSIELIRQLVKSINRVFFNNLLELPKVKPGHYAENPSIMAFYVYAHNTIYVNFGAIEETKNMLHRFSKLNIRNQNLNLNLEDNFLQSICYVIEHEICHLVVHKYLPEIFTTEIAHGPTFRKLVKHLFGHNWGDLAFVHIGQYIQSGFSKKKFFELLNLADNFDDEYREEVYKRLYEATTLSNFYKLLFPANKTRKNNNRNKSPTIE
jgi:hypothetical protein